MENRRILERAKSFLYQNARLLDRRRYEYFFEEGTKEAVIEALRPYQNRDGGFGNALEPDIRCPHSQPVPTEMALTIMDGFLPGRMVSEKRCVYMALFRSGEAGRIS